METLFIGQEIIRLDHVDSTNNYTNELLRRSVIHEGAVVVANDQSMGRGQRGNSWQSQPGENLTFTVVLKPHFLTPQRQFVLNKMVSLAICDALVKWGCGGVKVKWPNDVYVGDRKVAGILIENSIKGNILTSAIVGIGLNVNQRNFPPDIPNPTSLKMELGSPSQLDACLEELCTQLEANYFKVKADHKSLDGLYLDSLYGLDQWADFVIGGMRQRANIRGINPIGLLQLELSTGRKLECAFNEVEFGITAT